jgi:hypothetical protein
MGLGLLGGLLDMLLQTQLFGAYMAFCERSASSAMLPLTRLGCWQEPQLSGGCSLHVRPSNAALLAIGFCTGCSCLFASHFVSVYVFELL